MKIITKEGVKEFEKTFNSKLVHGNTLTPNLTFKALNRESLDKIIWKCRDKRLSYYIQDGVISLSQEVLSKILSSKFFEEKRIWASKDQYSLCGEMTQQHLSNTLGYLELMLKKGRISKKNSEDYLYKLQESIVPELEERFNGEILDYIPYYEWEKEMIKLSDIVQK